MPFNFLDVIIVLFFLGSIMVGVNLGFIRQSLFSFSLLDGLLFASLIVGRILPSAKTVRGRAIIVLVITSLIVFLCVDIALAYAHWLQKQYARYYEHEPVVNQTLGAIFGGVTAIIVIWILNPVFSVSPIVTVAEQVQSSAIISTMNQRLPAQPRTMQKIARLLRPFGAPRLFAAVEPKLTAVQMSSANAPALANAVSSVSPSVVKITGAACGFTTEGSGFYVTKDTVATNAHVVAGITAPHVEDAIGVHQATPIWFDPSLDIALLRIPGSNQKPIPIDNNIQLSGTLANIMGYPENGPLANSVATIAKLFDARGFDIYNRAKTSRGVYALQGVVRPGNSGGPLIDSRGYAVGLVFGNSPTQPNVGYALSMGGVVTDINAAIANGSARVSTQSCEE